MGKRIRKNQEASQSVDGDKPRQARRRAGTPTKAGRPASKDPYNFPKEPLERCVKLAQLIEEKNAGKPIPAKELVKVVGYHKPNDWRFLDLLRAGNMFGIVTGSGEAATVSLTDIGQDIVAPSSVAQRRKALEQAFNSVEVFRKVAEYYGDKRIPEDEYFANTLVREFNVPRDRIPRFTEVFLESLTYLRSFGAVAVNLESKSATAPKPSPVSVSATADSSPSGTFGDRQREFLDTCFVLMPFGGWQDVYYKDVYGPAIKAAGFEPLRADDLFHSGSVMEQIWGQINDAKVLLAEVTGKNANVFYELGLSHARGKPVVLLTANLEDVPFDLRHLRVIVYDVRDPMWAVKVQRSLTQYLRSAKDDPAKSIPQPFRDLSKYFTDEELEAQPEDVAVPSSAEAANSLNGSTAAQSAGRLKVTEDA